MLRHIAWFNEASIEPDAEGRLRSADARVHRRCLEPACALEDLGVACSVFGNLHDADPAEVCKLLQKLNTDIVVIGPCSDLSMFKLARAAKHLGCYIVADFADLARLSLDFDKLTAIADQIIVATPEELDFIKSKKLAGLVIPDVGAHQEAAHAAAAWMDCFRALKLKPPACANTNTPPVDHA
jgi:hypothetical protein